MSVERLLETLRRANAAVALAVGLLLASTALFVIVDVALRQLGRGLGGSDELSGYAMAIAASWGLGYALLERAHVRIDLVHRRLPGAGRALLDLVAIAALAATAALVAWQCWPVLEKSLDKGSRANTPLETPLAIPQALWLGGWIWFALSALCLLGAAIALIARGRRATFDRWFAATDELALLAEGGQAADASGEDRGADAAASRAGERTGDGGRRGDGDAER